jgi:hypothetical protein
MLEWFDRVGYDADIARLRERHSSDAARDVGGDRGGAGEG